MNIGVVCMNCLYLVPGIILIAVVGIEYSSLGFYTKYVYEDITFISYFVLVTTGIVLTTIIILIVCYQNIVDTCLKNVYFWIFPILLILQLIISIYGSIQAADTNRWLLKSVQEDMRKDFKANNVNTKFSDSFNILQERLECCGVYGPKDYEPNPKLPASCCVNPGVQEFCEEESPKYTTGCATKLYGKVTTSIIVVSAITLIITVLQMAGLSYIIYKIIILPMRARGQYQSY